MKKDSLLVVEDEKLQREILEDFLKKRDIMFLLQPPFRKLRKY
ncbi:MAG: hypothetical protein ACK4K4_05500 [Caldimicrobium sp.]